MFPSTPSIVMACSPVRATAEGGTKSAAHLALPSRFDNWKRSGKKGQRAQHLCVQSDHQSVALWIIKSKLKFFLINWPHTRNVPDLSQWGSLSRAPELHCVARCTSDTSPDLWAAAPPWTICTGKAEEDISRALSRQNNQVLCLTDVFVTWSSEWERSVWRRWTERPHPPRTLRSAFCSRSEEALWDERK